MCGRYTFFTDKEIREIDDIIEKINNEVNRDEMKTEVIYPTDIAPVLLPHNREVAPKPIKWGFPNFQNKGVVINARSETVHEKKMFRNCLENKRCVIPSTGFYEWNKDKKKFLFNLHDTPMLYMAGLYNEFEGENRFVILTTEANSSVLDVHSRMPLVLQKTNIEKWLFEKNSIDYILNGKHPLLQKQYIEKI